MLRSCRWKDYGVSVDGCSWSSRGARLQLAAEGTESVEKFEFGAKVDIWKIGHSWWWNKRRVESAVKSWDPRQRLRPDVWFPRHVMALSWCEAFWWCVVLWPTTTTLDVYSSHKFLYFLVNTSTLLTNGRPSYQAVFEGISCQSVADALDDLRLPESPPSQYNEHHGP